MGTFEQTSKKGVPLIPAVTSSIAGVRATTSERVKELKDARQDYFSLKDSKQQKQLEINKQYQENPEGAVKAINKFNDDQLKKLKQVQKVAGITDMDMKTMMNNFFITKVKDKKVVHGTEDAVRDLFKKAARSTNRQVVPAEKMNRIKELLGAKEGGGDDDE